MRKQMQMPEFNGEKGYHGTDAVTGGRLRGATGPTDYFHFFCPYCPGDQIMDILQYQPHPSGEFGGNQSSIVRDDGYEGFALAFRLRCERCGHEDFVKLSNRYIRGGTHEEILQLP